MYIFEYKDFIMTNPIKVVCDLKKKRKDCKKFKSMAWAVLQGRIKPYAQK